MSRFIFAFFVSLVFSLRLHAQCCTCPATWTTITHLFPQNSVTNFTVGNTWQDTQYLCGPNTIVYDTTHTTNCSCNNVLINNNCVFTTNNCSCSFNSFYYVKAGGTLNVLASAQIFGSFIFYEPGSIINDQSAGITQISCSVITLPSVNCTTGIQNISQIVKVLIYPNPCTDKLIITSEGYNLLNSEIRIINTLGKIVLKLNYSSEIDVSQLPSGYYNLLINNNNDKIIKKLVVTK